MRVDVYTGLLNQPYCHPASILVEAFKEYKTQSAFWAFGRDVPYHRPPKMADYNIRHLHIFGRQQYLHYQKHRVRLFDRTSDKHLVYAQSPIDNEHYLLIAILNPNAHQTAENSQVMQQIYAICKDHFG